MKGDGFVATFERDIGDMIEAGSTSTWKFSNDVLDFTRAEENGILMSVRFIMIKKGFVGEVVRKVWEKGGRKLIVYRVSE